MASRDATGFHGNQHQCRVFLHYAPPRARVHAVLRENLGEWHAKAMRTPRWDSHGHRSGAQFEVQRHLVASLQSHPWRVYSAAEADAILLVTPHERLCGANHQLDGTQSQVKLNWLQAIFWAEALMLDANPGHETTPPDAASGKPLRVLARQDSNCLSPHAAIAALLKTAVADVAPVARATAAALQRRYSLETATKRLNDMLQLVEYVSMNHMSGSFSLLRAPTPFVLPDEPTWLTTPEPSGGETGQLGTLHWSERRLLFFAGHMPKLYISRTRYLLWLQLIKDPRATVHSYDINCTIGLYAACGLDFSSKTERWFTHEFCKDACPDRARLPYPCMLPPPNATTPSKRLGALRARLSRQCKPYRQLDFEAEAAAIRRSSASSLPRELYLNHSLQHRFCLVAMGDQEGTPKLTEIVAVAGAGGCIPLIVLPYDGSPTHIARILPYSRWLDWCDVSWLVSTDVAVSKMAQVLKQLEAITSEEAAIKSRALKRVRNAFIWRLDQKQNRSLTGTGSRHGWRTAGAAGEGGALSSAADSILEDICYRADKYGSAPHAPVGDGHLRKQIAGGRHQRCMLLGNSRSQ